ncbi:hypothetical protein JAAARDRAFT_28623 [Jaapia argillacea MUCL 33604]|uniref:Phosphotransferase n=1 Tax=Jaapia argillacea MUCL 33604 TaxID=933084 RepID=A0A067QD43_9AGAM|nr:hypothetical protein JAAARDRAFT_28623 [Jaapia argillacea MUCL 33604]
MSSTSAIFSSAQNILDTIEARLLLSPDDLRSITRQFLKEFELGLGSYGYPMAMIPTFVTGVPDGSEVGTFLALDLGGTNLRVCRVQLHGSSLFTLTQQKYKLSESLKTGEASALFDYLADSVDAFLTEEGVGVHGARGRKGVRREEGQMFDDDEDEDADYLPLGFTFSFPVEQTALNSGKILTWTKGFAARNAVGNDVVKLLQDAFDRKHLHVRCVALVNDTVGALLSRSYTAGKSILGGIFGTGTNGAYLEDVSKITKLGPNHPAVARGGKMVVNTEWGGFDNARITLPSTPYDNILDRLSINPTYQAFEKFISGMYLGEITRQLLLSLVDAAPTPLLFKGKSTKVLNGHYGLDTAVLSLVEEAWVAGGDDAGEGDAGEGDAAGEGLTNGEKPAYPGPPAFSPTLTLPPHTILPSSLPPHPTPRTLSALERVRKVIVKEFGFGGDGDVSLGDAAIVRWASGLVARRAAGLSGCAVGAVLVQTGFASLVGGVNGDMKVEGENGDTHGEGVNGKKEGVEGAREDGTIGVGVDGSLIQHYPRFEEMVRESLRELVGSEVERIVEIGMAKDGSGVGAALCALQAIKQQPDILMNQAHQAPKVTHSYP